MANKPTSSGKKSDAQRQRTRINKIKAIKKALMIAGGQHVEKLNARLSFWENQK